MQNKLTYLGHAAFSIAQGGYTLVIDPYADGTRNYPPLRVTANRVIYSHKHEDHYNPNAVTVEETESAAFPVAIVDTFHDEENGAKRGANLVHIVQTQNLRICHLGDLGHLLNDEMLAIIGKVDLLMIPVGGFYTIDAADAWHVIDQIAPSSVIPMHYNLTQGEDAPTSTVQPFLDMLQPGYEIKYIQENSIDLADILPGYVYVLKPM